MPSEKSEQAHVQYDEVTTSMEPRYAMIIGAMKAGTTSLFDQLSSFPQVSPCCVKEPEFFSEHQRNRINTENYEALWANENTNIRIRLEASAGYSKFPREQDLPQRIKAYPLNPKFIYIVREPVGRIISHMNYMSKSPDWDLENEWEHMIELSSYHMQLEQFRLSFSREQIYVIKFDDLIQAPSDTLRGCCEFLGIDCHKDTSSFVHSNKAEEKSSLLWRLERTAFHKYGRRLSSGQKDLVKRMLKTLSQDKRVDLNTEQRRALTTRLAPEMLRLQEDYGVNISGWGY